MNSYNLYADTAESLENIAALGAATALCEFKINEEMVNQSVNALFSDPSELRPGGNHWDELQSNLQRINKLTDTESGKIAFCNRVSKDLSAFLD